MFTYVKLNNFLSLNNVTFDLKETRDKIKKIAVIYGENGCGKSTLIRSFYFLQNLIHTFDLEKREVRFLRFLEEQENREVPPILIRYMNEQTLSNLFKSSRTIQCEDNSRLEYGFEVNGHEGSYIIEYNDVIVYEKLYYFTGKQSGTVFEISSEDIKNPKLSTQVFKSNKIISEVIDRILKYWGKHSLISIVYDMLNNLNNDYIQENISNYLYDFHNMISETSIMIKSGDGISRVDSCKKINFLFDLESGSIDKENKWLLLNTEKILNDFFIQTYSDIKKVEFAEKIDDKRIKYKLLFNKYINGKIRKIPVENESTGTRKILEILRYLFGAFCGCTIIIDEVDNGIHDLLLKVVIDSMKDYITGQLIFTTHNTSLLESLDAKYVYIINGNYDGFKEIVCLSEYKLQDSNSARLRYMKGLFGGIPFVQYVDYNEIIENLKKVNIDT
ncbi:AAA family ATPase [bacterium]|nr:AAA family ATPase [bacterium]